MTGYGTREVVRRIVRRLGQGRRLLGKTHGYLAAPALRSPPLPARGFAGDPGPGADGSVGAGPPARRGTADLCVATRAYGARGQTLGRVRGRRRGRRARAGLLRREAAATARAARGAGAGGQGGGGRDRAGPVVHSAA